MQKVIICEWPWTSLAYEIYSAWTVFILGKGTVNSKGQHEIFSVLQSSLMSTVLKQSKTALVERMIWKLMAEIMLVCCKLRLCLFRVSLLCLLYLTISTFLFVLNDLGRELWCTLGSSIKEPWGIPWTGQPGQRILLATYLLTDFFSDCRFPQVRPSLSHYYNCWVLHSDGI